MSSGQPLAPPRLHSLFLLYRKYEASPFCCGYQQRVMTTERSCRATAGGDPQL